MGLVRNLFGQDRNPVLEQRFNEFVALLEQYELGESLRHDRAVSALYEAWAKEFELLKAQFNEVWDFFVSLEQRLSGWYAVSPNLAPWKSVACGRGGYSFAACIMKNHHRDAPLSEKSLSVSFALSPTPAGIGDERWVGRKEIPTDCLAGLPASVNMTPRRQAEGARAMVERLSKCDLIFRLNHRAVGQQAAVLPLETLKQQSLKDLCRGLFVLLNNDALSNLQSTLDAPQRLQLAMAGEIDGPAGLV